MAEIYSKSKANFLLGSLLNNPQLIYRKEYQLSKDDFQYLPHRILFVAINMLANEGVSNITPKEIGELLENYPSQLNVLKDELDDWVGFVDTIKELSSEDSFDFYYNSIRKYTLIRKYRDNGFDISKFWDFEKTDEINNAELDKYEIKDIIKYYDNTNADIKSEFSNSIDGSEVIVGGDGFDDFLDEMEISPLWGSSYLSDNLSSVTRGLIKGQLTCFSSPTGVGKSCTSTATICKLCATHLWNEETQQYEENPYRTMNGAGVIQYELNLVTEVTPMFISYISNIPRNIILDGKYTKEVKDRLKKANEIFKNSNIHLAYQPSFTCQSIEEQLKDWKNKFNIDLFVFDYLAEGAELNAELQKANGGVGMRTDQVLATFASRLKDMARKYEVAMYTMTQCNGNLAISEILGAECISGSRATAHKFDIGGIFMPLRPKEEKLIDDLNLALRKKGFDNIRPTHIFHLYKVRFGQYGANCKVWVNLNLATGRMEDYIVTDCHNKPLKVNTVKLINKDVDN